MGGRPPQLPQVLRPQGLALLGAEIQGLGEVGIERAIVGIHRRHGAVVVVVVGVEQRVDVRIEPARKPQLLADGVDDPLGAVADEQVRGQIIGAHVGLGHAERPFHDDGAQTGTILALGTVPQICSAVAFQKHPEERRVGDPPRLVQQDLRVHAAHQLVGAGVVAGEGLQVLGHAGTVGDADGLAGQRREVVEDHAFHKLARVGLLVALELGAEVDDAGEVVVAHEPRQILLARLVQRAAAQELRRRDGAPVGRRHAAQVARVVQPLKGNVPEFGEPGNGLGPIELRGLLLVDALLFRGHGSLPSSRTRASRVDVSRLW